jgi:hypothetical protein
MSLLADRLLAVHDGLAKANVAHAFGGAIALAYCTEEPRGTRDIDVNLFVDPEDVARVVAALPEGVAHDEDDLARIRRDGQVRLWWDDTPVDLFFDVHDFHREAPLHVRRVPFAGREIPVLGCDDLAVFKVMFGRTKDWADLEAMVEAGALDATDTLGWVTRLLGPDHASTRRIAALFSG